MFVSDFLAYTGQGLSDALAAGSKSAELWLTTKRLWGVARARTIEILTSNMTELEKKAADLIGIIHGLGPSKLEKVIWHISEKGETHDWGRTPDVNYTYQKILNGSAQYEVLLLPEYKGTLNWTETFDWISSNFTGIPIVLSTFEGGEEKLPNPNVQLTVTEIQQAMSTCDVRRERAMQ